MNDEEGKVITARKGKRKEYTPHHYYKPIGPSMPLLFFANTQGDANSIFLTDVIRSVGGWPMWSAPDWGLWIKLLANGHNVDVIPNILFYYRDRATGGSKTTTQLDIDKGNIQFIRAIIEKRPDLFSSCYESLHRLMRRPDAAGARASQELSRVRKTALYALDVKLGKLAEKSSDVRKFLEFCGRVLRKIVGEPQDAL